MLADQLVELGWILPGWLELLCFVVLRDQFVADDACAAHVLLLLIAQVIDAFADGFSQRAGERADRLDRHC